MKQFHLFILLLLALAVFPTTVFAGSYSVKVGEQMKINCTATAPAGYITHAFFNYVDAQDARYLGISYSSSDCAATIYGLEGKQRIEIEVTYAYSYMGSYDHNMHVGHGSYRDYITVVGGVKPKDVKIQEGDTEMYVGQTLELHAKLTPSNAETNYTWGFLDALGEPYKFDMTYIGGTAKVTSSRPGSVYVVCQTENDLVAVCMVTSKVSNEPATAIEITESEVKIMEGETHKLKCKLTPEYASNDVEWSSSNEGVATVSHVGKVTAVKDGSVVIKASTDNGLTAETKVVVIPKLNAISLPGTKQIVLGFSEKLVPSLSPANSEERIRWKSSNTDVAVVDADGVVQSKQTGRTEITAYGGSGIEATTVIEVVDDKLGLNYRNMQSRINTIQNLAEKTFNLNRK